ncbi:class I SAM-dependent methyltransferase [Halocatena halophila]|uniref:class I SAM-dependent methyltransferase n=1 Tax=Halocatena halophila TaxID=2814576 RepID=UPI002ED1CB9F
MAEKTAVREGYDQLAETYTESRTIMSPATEIARSFASSFSSADRVLDAGCGGGEPVLSLLTEHARTVGVDFSRAQLEFARSNAPSSELAMGDLTQLPYADDTFAGIVCYWALIHVPLAEHQTVIEEFARLLNPGGRLLLIEGTNAWTGENEGWLETDVRMEWEIAGETTTATQLERAGFEIVDQTRVAENMTDDDSDELPWVVFEGALVDY